MNEIDKMWQFRAKIHNFIFIYFKIPTKKPNKNLNFSHQILEIILL